MLPNHNLKNSQVQQTLLLLIATVLLTGLLKFGQPIFMPVAMGICLAFILMPIVDRLEMWRIPRIVGSLLALALTTGFILGMGMLLSLSLEGFHERIPHYQERAQSLSIPLQPLLTSLKLNFDLESLLNVFDKSILASLAGNSVLWAVDILAQGTVIFFVTLFLLLEAAHFRRKILTAFGLHNLLSDSGKQITAQIQRYLLTKTLISLFVGLVVWGFLAWMDVDFALMWGFVAFLLNYIPNLGPVIASVPPALLALVQFEDPLGYWFTISLGLLAIHMVIGNYLDPWITGETLNLSAFVIFVNLCFWGWLWGPMGMFISVPIIVALKVTLSHVPSLAHYATLLDE